MTDTETLEKPLTTKVNFQKPSEIKTTEVNKEKQQPVNNDEFVVDFNLTETPKETPAKSGDSKKGVEEPIKPNYSRFKEYVGKDEISEDDIETIWKKDREELNTYKTKAQKLEIIAQGKTRLNEDKDYQSWKTWLDSKPEDLVTASLAYEYQSGDGLTEAQAMAKAKERVSKNKEKDPDWIEDTARGIKKELRLSMSQKEEQVHKEIEEASKDISFVNPSSEFEKTVKDTFDKTEEFLGMKLPKDEKERKKLVSEAYLSPKELNEKLKDPTEYQEVCLYLKYKKQWKANIESRTNGKSKVLDKLPKTPSVGSGLTTRISQNAPSAKGFDGKGFLGR